MKVQVVLVVCSIFLQEIRKSSCANTYGVAIQAQPKEVKEDPITRQSVSDTSIVQPKRTTTSPTQGVIKNDSNTSISYPIGDETALDLNDPKTGARAIRNALTAYPVDTNAIIKIVAGKTRAQRLEIAEKYKLLFNTEITVDIKQKLSGWFKTMVRDLMIPLKEYFAKELYKAMHGVGTDEGALIEILCTMNNQEIREIKAIYEKAYEATLESHIECDTTGDFEDLLIALVNANRDESEEVDKSQAVADAKTLYKAGEGKLLGTDESTFITILTERNYKQLKLIFDEYQILTGHSIEYAIECEFSEFIQQGLLAIVKAIRDLPKFYAELLHASMAGSGTINRHLIRIIATRNEIDMDLIKKHYKANYGITLEEAIADDTSGDYKTLLLKFIRENPCQDGNLLACPVITIRNVGDFNS